VALLLNAYDPLYGVMARAHPDWIVAPNVIALHGPRPAMPVAAPPLPSGRRTPLGGIALGAGALIVVTLVGLGWSTALGPRSLRPFELLALAPSFGIALLILAGVLFDAIGLRLTGWQGALIVVMTALAGGAVAVGGGGARRWITSAPVAVGAPGGP
jgi:hypothetical protein